MARVLLVDDDETLLEILGDYLRRVGHHVDAVSSGASAGASLSLFGPDIVILDVSMPEVGGWQVLREIRESSTTPVIMLTARTEEHDVLHGFALGADDYMAKPFSFAQLEARIRAVLARSTYDSRSDTKMLSGGELQVDLNSHRVWRSGELIDLTPTEFRLLTALMEQPRNVLSSQQLVSKVWGKEYSEEIGYIRRYIWHLRRKIEPDPSTPCYIHSARNVGYYFEAV